MITPGWCHTMARYNTWQNDNIVSAADRLTDTQRREDLGAWFRSIHGTLSHLLWGDLMWMSRFDGGDLPPKADLAESATVFADWADYKSRRAATDRRILDWASRLEQSDVDGDLSWYSKVLQADLSKPRALCIVHMFNHQTHHRGQVHAMLTAQGVRPGDTDLPFMPDTI